MIAGHSFTEMIGGRRCACGILWRHVISAMREDIHRPGFAHVGNLSPTEYDEIEVERDRVFGLVVEAATS